MLRYRRLQIFVAAALAGVMAVGLGGALTPRREIFPFASWFLFSLVPSRRSEFDVMVHGAGERVADPGRPFNRADGLVSRPHSIVIYELIQELGDAEIVHNAGASRAIRRQIEADFASSVARYDLVRVTYAPVARWRTGQVLATEPLRSFGPGEP